MQNRLVDFEQKKTGGLKNFHTRTEFFGICNRTE